MKIEKAKSNNSIAKITNLWLQYKEKHTEIA